MYVPIKDPLYQSGRKCRYGCNLPLLQFPIYFSLATGLKKAHRTEFYRDLSLTDYAKEANPANDPMDSKSRAATWKKNRRQVLYFLCLFNN